MSRRALAAGTAALLLVGCALTPGSEAQPPGLSPGFGDARYFHVRFDAATGKAVKVIRPGGRDEADFTDRGKGTPVETIIIQKSNPICVTKPDGSAVCW